MTKDEVMQLLEVALLHPTTDSVLVDFARLIAARQREKDTEICESFTHTYVKDGERWMRGDNGKPDFRIKDVAPHLEAANEIERLIYELDALHKSYATLVQKLDAAMTINPNPE